MRDIKMRSKDKRFNLLSTFTQVLVIRNENEIRNCIKRKKQIEREVEELIRQNRELIGRC